MKISIEIGPQTISIVQGKQTGNILTVKTMHVLKPRHLLSRMVKFSMLLFYIILLKMFYHTIKCEARAYRLALIVQWLLLVS